MRPVTGWTCGLFGWLVVTGVVFAQTEGRDATVRAQWAEVRGNRSELFPVTGMLRQGQPVRVLREEDGYLAITPPPGSSSWIRDWDLKHKDPPGPGRTTTAFVLNDDAEVRLGGERAAGPLQFETVRLKRGTIVRVLGEKAFAEGKDWWRIQPPPTEVRYIAKDAVNLPTSTVVASSPAVNRGPALAMLANRPSHPKWDQAEQAEKVRDYPRAELLYRELAGEMAQPGGDHDLAIRCYNRIDQLSRRPSGTWPARQPAPGMLVSAAPPGVSAAPAPVSAASAGGSMNTGPGWLRRSSVQIDGKPVFVLEDNRSQPRYYVLAQPGLSLELYVNRQVDLFGTLVQRPDVTGGGYVSVSRLQLLR